MKLEIGELLEFCSSNMEDLNITQSWGETAIFYNPGGKLKRGRYVATIKESDGEHDKASNLNREGVYRLNIGSPKEDFISMFQELPKRPRAGCVVDMDYDFTMINQWMPHPVYAWMGWVCIVNPSRDQEDVIHELLMKSYHKVKGN